MILKLDLEVEGSDTIAILEVKAALKRLLDEITSLIDRRVMVIELKNGRCNIVY